MFVSHSMSVRPVRPWIASAGWSVNCNLSEEWLSMKRPRGMGMILSPLGFMIGFIL